MVKPFPVVCVSMIVLACCAESRRPAGDAGPPSTAAPATVARSVRLDFEGGAPGSLPAEMRTGRTGGGPPGTWVLERVEGAPSGSLVLGQTDADDTDSRFPLCVYEPLRARDVRAQVRFRALRGEVDQAAGVVVRHRDANEYYVARANALEGNVRLYRVVGGQRQQFAGKSVEVEKGRWHELGLEVVGSHFRVSLDGVVLFEADDAALPDAGRVGLWTKADSITQFDDLAIEVLEAR